MMNKQIRRMIDEIFADMKMTADNLALRDEMMANAQARFEDSVRAGKTEEEAFAEVAASLGDVQSLLHDMNAEKPGEDKEDKEEKTEEKAAKAEADEAPDFEVRTEKTPDIGDVLGKAFDALGDVGKQIVPQAQKLVRQVDDLTGGMIGGIGKAVGKGLSDAQKAAGKAIDKLSGDKGEIVVDFGEEKPKAPAALRERAQSIRAEAELKQAAGDQEGARALRAKAYALETEADEVEKKLAKLAEQEKAEKTEKPETDDELDALRREMDAMQESLNADAAQVEADAGCPNEPIDIDDVVRDAENAARQAEPLSGAPGMVVISRYPAAGLREVNVSLDSDDVTVKAADGTDVLVEWEAGREGVEQPTVTMEEHALNVRRANPDVFKTFFSVFQKEGGKVTVRVPRGYAADYVLGTTSGDIRLYAIDVKVNPTALKNLCDIGNRLQAANFIVHQHDRDQPGVISQGHAHTVGSDNTFLVRRQQSDLKSEHPLEVLGDSQDRRMFDCRNDDMGGPGNTSYGAAGQQGTLDRPVIGFGATGGENQFGGCTINQPGYLLPCGGQGIAVLLGQCVQT